MMDFILIMTAPRIGWLSATGMVAIALLGLAVASYASGMRGMDSLVVAALINLAVLSMDYMRNGNSK